MVIEWLKLRVSPERREEFIQLDAEIWTATLSSCPGFLGKEVWVNPIASMEVVLVIRWASRQQWKAVPPELLAETEQRFVQKFGGSNEIIEATEFQVRKFPLTSS
ncbi:TIGR03792 family protein [Lyngbya aestuarii]|uniref:TIGR03792 family protein n=1 Tax=Lyngbya aestuarii TaxID=118322 RepID=UPI00403DA0EC